MKEVQSLPSNGLYPGGRKQEFYFEIDQYRRHYVFSGEL